jgi:hypothetical protein
MKAVGERPRQAGINPRKPSSQASRSWFTPTFDLAAQDRESLASSSRQRLLLLFVGRRRRRRRLVWLGRGFANRAALALALFLLGLDRRACLATDCDHETRISLDGKAEVGKPQQDTCFER